MTEDQVWMRKALEVASAGLDAGELPIGAVVVLDGDIVSSAYTQERSQGRLLVHAELLALDAADRLLGRRRREALLYTTLEPCLGCLGAAMTVMVGTVVFGLSSRGDGAVSCARAWDATRASEDIPGYRFPVLRGDVLAAESQSLFERFVSAARPEDPMAAWARTLTGRI